MSVVKQKDESKEWYLIGIFTGLVITMKHLLVNLFNKKKMMRDKIVNKSLCQPLPQDIRFEAITHP